MSNDACWLVTVIFFLAIFVFGQTNNSNQDE